jgi:hypothetical protein
MAEIPPPTAPDQKTPQPIPWRTFDDWMQHAPCNPASAHGITTGFWKITAGNVVSVVITLIAIVYSAGRVNERLDSITSWKQSVEDNMKRMDSSGTSAGNAAMRLVEQKNLEQDREINGMREEMSKIIPDLRELKTKLDDAIFLLQDGKNGKMTNR